MLALISIAISLVGLPFVEGSDTVQLGGATLVGRPLPLLHQTFFGGIPYAKPPVGALRFKPPVLLESLPHGTFDATNFGTSCLQADLPISESSEDCLTINVFRPSGIDEHSKLPVFAWIYGGAYVTGTANLYNGSEIVAQSIARGTPLVYVNFNYRVGALGFPQGHEAAANGAFNLGLKDQLTALEWIQRHISTFGGDKDKVTVAGQSAGAESVSLHFMTDAIAGLARAGIMQSGAQATSAVLAGTREDDWQNFVSAIAPCASLATSGSTFDCLRSSANTTEIFQGVVTAAAKTTHIFPWSITLDGPHGVIPELPAALLKKGKFSKLPFITGNVLDEGTSFVQPTIDSVDGLIGELQEISFPPTPSETALDDAINNLLALYPDDPALGSPYNTGNETFGLSPEYKRAAAVIGDTNFLSQVSFWRRTATSAGVKTFGYFFTQPQPLSPPEIGVAHSSDLNYVYGTVPANDTSPAAFQLSKIIIDYWVSFATSLDPNDKHGNPRPHWTQYTPHSEMLMQLHGENITMIPDDFHKDQVSFINSDPTPWRH
ncbi:extracellular triacylglycerol lipase precursor [Mycena pura]|uniref:Carboxylic ester hydrolase n=1 Tax=Mycena pura TaxID=153505 RepID=A0AAD6UZL3_9AGAR|nr:extracellular triacylglycerol lipase precursor [Mycena pura]